MKRSEQKINDTWNMEDMFPSDKVWEEDFEKATKEVAKYKEFSGKIKDSKDKLIEFLKFNDEISLLAERLYVYANQKYHEDMGNGQSRARRARRSQDLRTAPRSRASMRSGKISQTNKL